MSAPDLSRVLADLAASGQLVESSLVGSTIGEYRVISRIGEGGMGTVYGAVHPIIGKRVAIKVMRADLGSNADVVERFLREARAVARIGHPNIVDIFSFGTLLDGRNYFVMEWLEGTTLSDRTRTPMTLGEVAVIVDQIARALEAAHAASVVHRDLKPENVFLVETPGEPVRVKLLDFGIAKLTDDSVDHTSTGLVLGTPLYVSPEQARGLRVDARSDIYSLGVMMFELMAGTLPFVAVGAYDLLTLHVAAAAPPATEFHPGLAPSLCDLLAAMLAKDPAARPTLAAVRETIASFAKDRSQPMTWAPRAVARVRARGSVAPGTQPVTGTSGESPVHVLVEQESGVLISPLVAAQSPARVLVEESGVLLSRPLALPHAAPSVIVAPAPTPHATPLAIGAPARPRVGRRARIALGAVLLVVAGAIGWNLVPHARGRGEHPADSSGHPSTPASTPPVAPVVVLPPTREVTPTIREVTTPTVATPPRTRPPRSPSKRSGSKRSPSRSEPMAAPPSPPPSSSPSPTTKPSTVRDPFASDVHDPFAK